jgi:hypothetical protein
MSLNRLLARAPCMLQATMAELKEIVSGAGPSFVI